MSLRVHRPGRVGASRGAGNPAWYDSPWRIAGHALSTALTIVVLALVAALVLVPRLTGGAALTVLSGSMEPVLSPGDVIVTSAVDVADVCTDIQIGSIVTYLVSPDSPDLITHRVIGRTVGSFDDGTSCRLILQGDANTSVDDPVSPEQVRGVLRYAVPGVGWARQWAGDNTMALVTGGAVLLIGYGIWSSTRRPRTRVVEVPGAGAQAAPAPHQPPASAPAPAPAPVSDRELSLRERELALREREVALRERELQVRDPSPAEHGAGDAFPTEPVALLQAPLLPDLPDVLWTEPGPLRPTETAPTAGVVRRSSYSTNEAR